jgi:hypothetical protein
MMGGRGRGDDGKIDVASVPQKKPKWKHSKKGQSGTIKKRTRKTQRQCEDDDTEVC